MAGGPRLDRLTPEDLPLGLGRYRLVVALGERSEGRVYRAEHPERPRGVEITTLWPALLLDGAAFEEVADDLRAARAADHPGLVRVLDVGSERRVLWFASEPLQAATLAEAVAGPTALGVRQAAEIFVELLDALAHLHAGRGGEPLLHRGLNPSRVLVDTTGTVRLRGVGLGALPAPGGRQRAGALTPWASPEQIGRRELTPASDLFSAGALLYYALRGKPAFRSPHDAIPSERVGEIVRVLARGDIWGRVDRKGLGLGSVLQGLLAVDPAARFESAAEARDALRVVAERLPPEEHLAALAGRILVDHAATVAAPMGSHPTSRDLLPLRSLEPVTEIVSEDEPTTDADMLLPSQRLEQERLALAASRGASPPRPAPVDIEATAPGPIPAPMVSDLGSRRTAAMPRDALPPRPAPPRPAPPASPPTAPPRPPVPPRVSAPRPAPPAPRPAPPAPRPPSPGVPASAATEAPSWAPAAPPGAPGLAAPRPRAASGVHPVPAPAEPPRRRRTKRPAPSEDEGGAGRLIPMLAGATIVLGGLGMLLVQLSRTDEAPPPPEPLAQVVPADPDPLPTPAPRPEPTPEPTPEPPPEPTPEPALEPAVVRTEPPQAPAPPPRASTGPVALSLNHRPVKRGDAGASELVSVKLDGPSDSSVLLHYGPPGGPYASVPLRGKSGGRWEEWLPLDGAAGATVQYWVEATHPDALRSVASGSRSAPHAVKLE